MYILPSVHKCIHNRTYNKTAIYHQGYHLRRSVCNFMSKSVFHKGSIQANVIKMLISSHTPDWRITSPSPSAFSWKCGVLRAPRAGILQKYYNQVLSSYRAYTRCMRMMNSPVYRTSSWDWKHTLQVNDIDYQNQLMGRREHTQCF